jgi:sugar transferase (PEP-CTERM/EpsH1 system associated)
MRLLYVAQRVPYPPNRGDKITTYHEILHLAGKHAVSVACLAEDRDDLDNVKDLAQIAASVDAVPLSRQRARGRALCALPSGKSLTVAYFGEPELHRRVADVMSERRIDAIIVYSSGVAQFVERYADVPRIMQFADLDSLKWEQYARMSSPPMRWVYQSEYRRLLRYESRLASTFNHSLVSTKRELEDFRRLIPGTSVSCVTNGVDLEYFRPTDTPAIPDSLIFMGVMDYFPNVEAVTWFSKEVLPLVRREIPAATFTICGARPTADVLRLAREPGVIVTGRVPDVRPYLARAAVGVVPLRIARGIQNKLLEAMAMGLPAVSTTAAYLGIEAVPGKDLLVADGEIPFADAVVRLLKDERLRREMGLSARNLVAREYTWETQMARLDLVLERVCSGAPAVP